MKEIIDLLPVLVVAVLMNIGAGLYYNIGTNNVAFNKTKLLNGILKALIVCGMFIGTAYCFDSMDLSSIGPSPQSIINSAILIYVGKGVVSLAKILGVNIENKRKVNLVSKI